MNKTPAILSLLLLLCAALPSSGAAHMGQAGDGPEVAAAMDMNADIAQASMTGQERNTGQDHAAWPMGQDSAPGQVPMAHEHATPDVEAAPSPGVGVTEHLGAVIPDDVILRDEDGQAVNVKDLVGLPTILVPVYLSCPNECSLLLGSLGSILPRIRMVPGKDYQILAVSFDENDTPDLARRRKNDYMTSLRADFPQQYWKFLTGDAGSIRRLMDAIGFGFRREGMDFRHPVVLVALAPGGKITRYLYGIQPLPFDVTMALTDASQGRLGLSVQRAIALCYSYDPQSRRYVFDLMKVTGAVVLTTLGLFFLFLVFGGKKRRR